MSHEFKREERYFVIKISDLRALGGKTPDGRSEAELALVTHLDSWKVPTRESIVVESDWPEYEAVWKMIERRINGQPPVTAAEELQAVLHWRDKHAQAIKERDALQQRLNTADQRVDDLETDAGHNDDLLTDVYLIAKRLAARLLEVSPDDAPAKDAIAALRQKAQLTTLIPQ